MQVIINRNLCQLAVVLAKGCPERLAQFMACLPRARQVMPPPAPGPTPEELERQRANSVAKRLSFASALNELSGQYGLLSGAHLTMLVAVTGASELVAGRLMVSQSVAAALAEFIATPLAGQLSDSGGRRRVLIFSAIGSAALRTLVVAKPSVATVWIAKLGDALVCKSLTFSHTWVTLLHCTDTIVAAATWWGAGAQF